MLSGKSSIQFWSMFVLEHGISFYSNKSFWVKCFVTKIVSAYNSSLYT